MRSSDESENATPPRAARAGTMGGGLPMPDPAPMLTPNLPSLEMRRRLQHTYDLLEEKDRGTKCSKSDIQALMRAAL
jgi:hypothetical protein